MADENVVGVAIEQSEFEIDPGDVRTRAQFGEAVTALRERQGLTVRDVAKLTGLPISTLGGYFAGRHLPPLKPIGQLALLLQALGVRDPATLESWKETVRRLRRSQNPPSRGGSPYRGLACFEPEDAEWFFGREQLTDLLVKRVGAGGMLAVVGPSGSGKSSVLRSGLIPGLSRGPAPALALDGCTGEAADASSSLGDDMPVILMTPGPRPLQALADALSGAGFSTPGSSLVAEFANGNLGPVTLVADQFEELFTQCADETERRRIIAALCSATRHEVRTGANGGIGGRCCVILGIRADFYVHALRYPELAQVLQRDQVIVGPMSEAQLRRAIVEPARRAAVGIEPELVERLLRDIGPVGGGAEAAHHVGALPLLSHALLATWERTRQGTMTVADYEAVGGISGGVARTAEQVLTGLDEPDREFARQLFTRLVQVSDDTEDTRRRLPLSEILDEELSAEQYESRRRVVDAFVGARLLTAGDNGIEITHEALLAAWPQLRDWLGRDRQWLQRHRELGRAAAQWRDAGRDPDQLYRGAALQAVRDFTERTERRSELNGLEREFLDSSVEQARASARRERILARRRNQLGALLAVVATSTVGALLYAHSLQATDNRERTQALSRLVAGESDQLRGNDVSLSMQLALAAYRISPTPEALSSLLDSTGVTPDTRIVPSSPSGPDAESIATAGNVLAVGTGSKTVQLWSLGADGPVTRLGAPLPGGGGAVWCVAFAEHGRLLAAGSASGAVRLWDTSVPTRPRLLATVAAPGGQLVSLALSTDGRLLGVGTGSGVVALWNVSEPTDPRLTATLDASAESINSLAFNPAGTLLAAGSADNTVRLWNLSPGARPSTEATLQAGSVVFALAVSPDGRTLAAGTGAGHDVMLWNLSDSGQATVAGTLTGPASWVNAVAFSLDGRTLGAASSDGRLWLFDLATRRPALQLPHPNTVTGVAFRPDGTPLTVSVDDGTVRWWRLPGPVILGAKDSIFAVAFSSDGRLLGVAPGSRDNTVTLWNVADPRNPLQTGVPVPGLPGSGSYSGSGAVSPDGGTFAIGDLNGTIQLWNVRDPAHPVRPLPPIAAGTALIESVGFSADGRLLAAAGDDGSVHVYDMQAPGRAKMHAVVTTPGHGKIYQAAFSPDDALLAAASDNAETYVYDIRGRTPRLVATLGGSPSAVYSAAFISSEVLAVGNSDGSVRIWRVGGSGDPVALSGPLGGSVGYVYSLAYANGVLAVSGSQNGSIWLWDVSNPARPVHTVTISGPVGGVFSVALRRDGKVLAAGGVNDSAQLWSTDPATAEAWICSVTGTPITEREWAQYVPGQPYDPPCTAAASPR